MQILSWENDGQGMQVTQQSGMYFVSIIHAEEMTSSVIRSIIVWPLGPSIVICTSACIMHNYLHNLYIKNNWGYHAVWVITAWPFNMSYIDAIIVVMIMHDALIILLR